MLSTQSMFLASRLKGSTQRLVRSRTNGGNEQSGKKGQCNEEGVGSRLGLVVGAMAGKGRRAGTTQPGSAGFDTSGTKRAFELADSTRLAPTVPLKGRKHPRMGTDRSPCCAHRMRPPATKFVWGALPHQPDRPEVARQGRAEAGTSREW